MTMKISCRSYLLVVLSGTGCAFNVINLKESPARLEPVSDQTVTWTLQSDAKVKIASGFATPLKGGTLWRKTGQIAQGDVLKTSDQVVTVEASNMYEAEPVLSQGRVVGFYLPVEHAFTPADPSLPVILVRDLPRAPPSSAH